MVLYPNKLPESERVCSGICKESDSVIYKTSQQIQDELSDMAEISINQIAATLVELNYKLTIGPDGRPAWMMQRR
jgi:hypothetical protein